MYVLLWPIISASSFTPPTDILTKFLLVASAIDLARVVLPTPGGPDKQIMGDVKFLLICFTAKYSIILSFTLSNP